MHTMKNRRLFLAVALGLPAMPLLAEPLETLPHGTYICSLPGNAAGMAWREQRELRFEIDNASTYHTDAGSGTYLLAGKQLTFTRGPLKGQRYRKTSSNMLRKIEGSGEPGRVRCVRGVPTERITG